MENWNPSSNKLFKEKNMKTHLIYFFIFLFFIATNILPQIIVNEPINISKGVQDSSIKITTNPSFTWHQISRAFDGNHLTEAIINKNNISITLEFKNQVSISKSKVFFWNNGTWSLETANTLLDLENKTGSYKSLANNRNYSFFVWDSVAFQTYQIKFIKLTAKNPSDTILYIGEWVIESFLRLTSLKIIPVKPRVIPNASLQLDLKVLDEFGRVYPYNLTDINWSSLNTSVASIDNNGKLKGVSIGSTTIQVNAENNHISGSSEINVTNDFQSEKVSQKIVKVALVIQDPVIQEFGYKRIHEKWNWQSPISLVTQIQQEFLQSSDSTVKFQIVESYNDQNIFTKIDSNYMTLAQIAYYFQNNQTLYTELKYIAETQNRIKYDYNGMVDFYDFDTKRNNGTIDEVWVYAFPFGGMYESQLMGPGAFWWNSPPLAHPGLNKCLSVMGWNYERGVAEAMHSVGHRAESALWKTYGRWNLQSAKLNNWEIFTSINKELPNKANVGNIHFPPNAISDYDYSNSSSVITFADNWKRYPFLLDQKRTINCQEWGCTHLGYMKWWFNHLPRYKGVTADTILNNWWHYFLDYYDAVATAKNQMALNIKDKSELNNVNNYELMQNYPNPFSAKSEYSVNGNSSTSIRYGITKKGMATLKVFNTLGEEIATLVNDEKLPGFYEVQFSSNGKLSSGIYFYQLQINEFRTTKKMVLVK